MNSVRSNNISLKYQRSTTLGSKEIGIKKLRVCDKDSIPLNFILFLKDVFLRIMFKIVYLVA